MGGYSGPPTLTFLQLVLHNHQEGNANHEEVEAEAHLAQSADGSAAHLTHHILVRLLPADWRGITENNQAADEENQRNLQKKEGKKGNGMEEQLKNAQVLTGSIIRAHMWNEALSHQGEEDGCEKNHQA